MLILCRFLPVRSGIRSLKGPDRNAFRPGGRKLPVRCIRQRTAIYFYENREKRGKIWNRKNCFRYCHRRRA